MPRNAVNHNHILISLKASRSAGICIMILILCISTTVAVAQWLRCCDTNRKVAGSIPAGVSGFFIDIKSFRSHYGPAIDSASKKWVPRVFPGGKGSRWVRLTTYHHPMSLSRNLGNLNFLETSGPVQACNGRLLYSLDNTNICTGVNKYTFTHNPLICDMLRFSSHLLQDVIYIASTCKTHANYQIETNISP